MKNQLVTHSRGTGYIGGSPSKQQNEMANNNDDHREELVVMLGLEDYYSESPQNPAGNRYSQNEGDEQTFKQNLGNYFRVGGTPQNQHEADGSPTNNHAEEFSVMFGVSDHEAPQNDHREEIETMLGL